MSKPSEAEIDAAIEASNEKAAEIFDDLLDQINEEEDPVGVAYALWISLGRLLAEDGWTAEQLATDATWHANHQQAAGQA